MSTELFSAAFEDALSGLPGSADIADFRRDQMAAFRAAGLPTTRHEDWRYTNIATLASGGFQAPAADIAAESALDAATAALALPGAYQMVFINGSFDASRSTLPPQAGLKITSLRQALNEGFDPAGFSLKAESGALAALNAAWMHDGAFISVAPGVRIDPPIYLLFISSGAERIAVQPRVLIELAPQAEATVIQHFVGTAESASWLNTALEANIADQGRLCLTTVQEGGPAQVHTNSIRAVLMRDSTLTIGSADFGASLARHDIHVELARPGAAVDMFGVFFPRAGQHMDIHSRIDHLAPNTSSREDYHGMAGERGRGVFNGKVVVHPNAQGIDARQSSKNLLLGERCEIDTKPELEIYADDVKCSHGATVGELDHDALFYLLSRGLSEDTARALLTYAFANEIIERLSPAAVREHVARTILEAIPETGLTEELAEVLT